MYVRSFLTRTHEKTVPHTALMPPGLQDAWDKTTAIVYVTLAQMLCGIAKDLVKLGGKAVTKLVTPNERQGMLFSLVSYVTGFKNSMKGMGYLAGALIVGAFPAGTHTHTHTHTHTPAHYCRRVGVIGIYWLRTLTLYA